MLDSREAFSKLYGAVIFLLFYSTFFFGAELFLLFYLINYFYWVNLHIMNPMQGV